MSNRDDFTAATKQILAERCGFRCSYLGCGNATVGPSSESDTSVSRTGVACHISAAAAGRGARRYNSDMTSEERSSISNGIWMCATHSIEIDRDEFRYTESVLKHWKKIAEEKADLAKSLGWEIFDNNNYLPVHSLAGIQLDIPVDISANGLIGNAIFDSSLPYLWGKKQAIIIRDLIIELYRNAYSHGNANYFRVEIRAKEIEITYDGLKFNIFELLSHKVSSGGADTLKEIFNNHKEKFAINYSFSKNNRVILHWVADFPELLDSLPCVISINEFDTKNLVGSPDIHKNCGAIYIVLPMHFCPSDVRGLTSNLSAFDHSDKPVFIVGSDLSENTKRAIIAKFPKFTFIHNNC